MPPKKGAKGKGKKDEKPEEEEVTEYDRMPLEMLREVIPMLRQQLEKAQMDRNYVQLERDTVNGFYEITKRDVREYEMAISAKDREMELMEENHRVEVRVYMQKVKHLEYEHKHSIKSVTSEGRQLLHEEHQGHEEKERGLKGEKLSLKAEGKEKEGVSSEEVMALRQQSDKNLQKMREGFDANLADLRDRCENRLRQLEDDLELRRKVDMHEMEERKNLHINDLMRSHDKAFRQMKTYYNDITNDNLRLIKSLKDDVSAMKKKAVENQKLMYDISQENKNLSLPLAAAVAEVAKLQGELRDREKDRLSLRNAKARLVVLESQFADLEERQNAMSEEYRIVERDRDDLYATFESAVGAIQEQSNLRNMLLEQKIDSLEQSSEHAVTQLSEVAGSANLDLHELAQMTEALDDVLVERNKMIRELQYMVTRAAKTYNDSLKTFSAKLVDLGIPSAEVSGMGFEAIPTSASVIPAGLVAR